MTDEREKSSRTRESLARTTARDVPYVRGADDESDPAPRGQRPAQLPRDLTYETELAQVELAVMRDPARREDPSTKQGGGRRAHQLALGQPPESVTPESPGARARGDVTRSPDPPSSSGRAVASGTLLSVGAVDPRGKTERTLETPRMFFSQPDNTAEAYFKPGKIPAVTVHQTLETETVKLSDSVNPRRAKTIPRLDRAELAGPAEREADPDSESPVEMSQPSSDFDQPASDIPRPWNDVEYEPASSLGEHDQAGQIHASLSPFRDQGEPSFRLDGVSTRPEPYVARRASEPPPTLSAPDPSVIPTQRDLPQHRIEASMPPPAPVAAPTSSPVTARAAIESAAPFSDAVSPTTASIAAEEPVRTTPWRNYAAFVGALLLALLFGLWLTSGTDSKPPSPDSAKSALPPAKSPEFPAVALPPAPRPLPADVTSPPAPVGPPPAAAVPLGEPRKDAASAPQATPAVPAAPPPAARRKSPPPQPIRETIF